MPYRIAGMDVHKKMLAVAVTDVMESTAQYWRPVWEALEQH